jgi:hypothetical protein
MAEMRASPVKSKTLKRLADIVRMAEDQGQMEFLPFNPMTLFPVSSTTLENLAYGNLPMAIPSQSNIPITKTGRKQEVAELAGLLPMVPATSRGVTQGANYLGDVMTQAVTRNPQATSMRALSEISQMSPVSQMFDPALAKRVMPETAVVDEAGNPRLMYHGTAKDIQEFKPGQAEASFVSADPDFAEKFTEYSQERSIKEIADRIDQSPAEKEKLLSGIIDRAMERGDLTSVNFPEHQELAKAGLIPNLNMYTKNYWLNSFMNRPLKDVFSTVGIGKDVTRSLSEMTPTGPNILPVYVNAKNPFDYQNPAHLKSLIKNLPDDYDGTSVGMWLMRSLERGDWDAIESADVQETIKKLGFDGFYVNEHGTKNLGVYDPKQIKSAISNEDIMEQFLKGRP